MSTVKVKLSVAQTEKLEAIVEEIESEWRIASRYKKKTIKMPWWRPNKEYWPKQPDLKWHYITIYCPYTSSVIAERLGCASALISVNKLAAAGDELYLSPGEADVVARYLK